MTIENVTVTQQVTNVQVAQVPATNLTVQHAGPINVDVATVGLQGATGPRGSVIMTGTSDPAPGTGDDGDWFLNNTTWDILEKTDSTTWTVRGNLKGVKGDTGNPGATGPANSLSIGSVTASAPGSAPVVTIGGTAPSQTISFTLPRGDTGPTGPAPNLAIGTVDGGVSAAATITGSNPNYVLNLTIPKGDKGDVGAQWYAGAAPAPAGTGVVGDYFLVATGTGVGDVYQKTSASEWTLKGNIRGQAGTGNTNSVNDILPDTNGNISLTWSDFSGTIPASALPSLATTETYTVASEAAMLALSAQRGDLAIRTDTEVTYILAGDDATVLGNWTALSTNGSVVKLTGDQTIAGVKTFTSAPVVPDASFSIGKTGGLQTALDGKAPKNTTEIYFSQMSGANDDERLQAAMAAAQALTLKGCTIVLDENRDYTFTQQVTLFSGFSLRGAFRPQDQARASRPIGNRVLLRMAGGVKGWLKPPAGSIFGVSVTNLSIDGDINSYLVEGNESVSGVLWTSVFRDISIQNAAGVFGSPTNKLLVTATTVDGWWNINNVQERAFNIGGSDFYFKPSMLLLDSPVEMLSATKYLGSLSFMSNSWWSNVYCTAEGHSALLLEGSNNSSVSNWIFDSVFEGRNANSPSPGALIRVSGGQYILHDNRFAFAMTNPSATGRNDGGVIHVSNGNVTINNCTYERATGVAESVPFVYVTGGKVTIRNIIPVGPWTGKPVVFQTAPGLIDADDSVIIQTKASAEVVTSDATSASSNTGTSITIPKPVGTVAGDLLVAATGDRSGSAPYTTPPAGWTAVAPTTDNTAPGVVRFWYKVATASEPTSYAWTGGGSGRHVGTMFRVTNFDASIFDGTGAVATLIGGPDRIILPSVTTTTAGTLLLGVGFSSTTGGAIATFSGGGMTAIKSANTTTGASESALTVLYEKVGASGATGTRSIVASTTASTGSGYMLAIKSNPAAVIATPSTLDAKYDAKFAPKAHSHDAGELTGTFDIARIPTGTTGTTVALGNHLHTGVYEPVIAAGTTSQYRRGDNTWATLDKAAVGLSNVANVAQVDLSSAQTIAGVKTFSAAPIVPDDSWAIAKTSGLQNALDAKVAKSGDTMTGTLTLPSLALPTPGVGIARIGTLPGVQNWVGTFINSSFNGTGWVLDDTTKWGMFFKLDVRTATDNFAVYRIPPGAGNHTDETPVIKIDASTAAVTFAGQLKGVSNATLSTDALPLGQADGRYAPLANPTFTGTVSGITKAMIGLANVPDVDTSIADNISSGTIPDARLPQRLREEAGPTEVGDWNNAVRNGWYFGHPTAGNAPRTDQYAYTIGTVVAYNPENLMQTVTAYALGPSATDSLTYRRHRYGAVWGAWYKLSISQGEQDARYARSTGGGQEKIAPLSATAGTAIGDLAVASIFPVAPTGNITLAFTNIPPPGNTACVVTVIVVQGATVRTVTPPAGTKWMGAPAPTQVANKTCAFTFMTIDGGTTWYASAAVEQ